ncbi:hypothetical protein BDN72DRAFT_195675 [Pluteus cervinus]|uniref:Uncharacterized protein n=1 Tax=Pluteus cervinus TaxID=181527 RepID=A0ACD3AIK5_9AGAR|nr:hypothetical protein BDN72DRAFT_195675 [Pluteus cervinus]
MRAHRWILLLSVVYFHAVQASPLPSLLSAATNSTNIFIRDTADPSSGSDRTLYSIARSCLLTLGACVYRAIHPNIPRPNATAWQTLRERLIIMAYMLLVPELVIYWAAEQWSSAHTIAMKVTKEVKRSKGEEAKTFQWTAVHGHYLQMGGYLREDNEEVLTSASLVLLVKRGKISVHDLQRCTEKRIKDRSKGDILSKAILTLQTSWFIIQSIARLAKRLDLAELEVVTLAFCVLNIATFLLWWSKPLDVHSPTYLRISGGPSTILSVNTDPPTLSSRPPRDSGFDQSPDDTSPADPEKVDESLPSTEQPAQPHRTIYSTITYLINHFFQFFSHLGELSGFKRSVYSTPHGDHVGRFYREEPTNILLLFLGNIVLGVVFGAIHFMSWSSVFPTQHEQLLWRISTIVATVFPLAFVVLGLVSFKILRRLPQHWLSSLVAGFVGIVFVLAILLYVVARLGLFIQALVALRKLPASVFDNIVWSSFFPHF